MEQLKKDILIEIVRKGDKINLDEITEGWEAIKTIQSKTNKFLEKINDYKNEIDTLQEQLRLLRKEERSIQAYLKTFDDKKIAINEELQELQKQLEIKKIRHNSQAEQQELINDRNKILPGALRSVEIYLKDGSITKAKPAQRLFSEDLYKKYRVELKENRILKARISELELENKRLEIELRDFLTDLKLEGMGALESKKDKNLESKEFKSNEKPLDSINSLNSKDLNELKEIITNIKQDELSTQKSQNKQSKGFFKKSKSKKI